MVYPYLTLSRETGLVIRNTKLESAPCPVFPFSYTHTTVPHNTHGYITYSQFNTSIHTHHSGHSLTHPCGG